MIGNVQDGFREGQEHTIH